MATKKEKIKAARTIMVDVGNIQFAKDFSELIANCFQELLTNYALHHGFQSSGGFIVRDGANCEYEEAIMCFLFSGDEEDAAALNAIIKKTVHDYMKDKYGIESQREENPQSKAIH